MGSISTKNEMKAEFEDLKRDLNEGKIPEVVEEYRKHLDEMQDLPLNIAVTGQTGSGKSSFVNAIRGVKDGDVGAAKVGMFQKTMEPKSYPHPSFPNIQIWDLPGIGTREFKAAEYLNRFNFETYDVFIIIADYSFTENDALLAKEIRKVGKKFYFVCSKMDISMGEKKGERNFNMEKPLETLRNYFKDNLKSAGESSASVFLISSKQVEEYDFPLLKKTIADDLPDHKKHILILALNVFSEDNLMKKKELMKSYIKKAALISCTCGLVPVPGTSITCDVGILTDALIHFSKVFGLNKKSLCFLANQTGKEYEELKSAIKKTPLGETINAELILSLLMKSASWVAVSTVEVALYFIPVLGSLFGGASSYVVTYRLLNSFLDDAVEDARNVRAKLIE